jgi:hypothetical protein
LKLVRDFNKDRRNSGQKEIYFELSRVISVKSLAGYSDLFNKQRKEALPPGIVFDETQVNLKGECYIVGDENSISSRI